MLRTRLTLLFFCSGALSLVYEVLWQRRFTTVFGGSAPATAAVLVAFFAGLGVGSRFLGRAAIHFRRPLRAYAGLEAAIGAGALFVSPILGAFDALHGRGLPPFAVGMAAACAAVALPTLCMGGTLPAMARFVDGGERRLGVHAGLLYAANTAGAALGALSVPFLLLPALGATWAVRLAVAGNAMLALAALALDRSCAPIEPGVSRVTRLPRAVLAGACFSGLATMALQIEWNRAFRQVHENSVHAFAVIVAVFIAALAIGAALARALLRRGTAPARLLAAGWIAGGIAVAASAKLFLLWTHGLDFVEGVPRLLGLACAILFVPLLLVGLALPALLEEAGIGGGEATEAVGRVLAANVVGSVAGALLAGFLLPGRLGLWSVLLLTSAALVLGGAWRLDPFRGPVARRVFRSATALGFVALLGPIAATGWPRVRIAEDRGERLVALSEGANGIVAVVERPGSRRLKLDNSYVLGGTAATGDERMQMHLPLLLHPLPRRVAALGVGTGISASGALFHPVVERLIAVELIPEVVAAARTQFGEANLGVLTDPRTQVVLEDARRFLESASASFDVIVGDLVVPWRRGESVLYTAEQFRAARSALAPGGLFCQWVPLFQLSEREPTIVLRTFLTVFPRAWVWRADFSPDESAIALIAGADFEPRPEVVARRVGECTPDSTNPQLADPIAVWMYLAGVLEPADLPAGETRVHRDDRPWLELLGPLRSAALAGRREQEWLAELGRRSSGRLAGLGERERRGMAAGATLFEFTLSLRERDEAGAREARSRLRELLPEATFRAIF